MLVVMPVSTGETYTAYSNHLGEYDSSQVGITLEQLKMLGKENSVNTDIDNMTPYERNVWLMEVVGYYSFDQLAVVDTLNLNTIETVANSIYNGAGSELFEMFNQVVIGVAEKTIPFYNSVVIEVDPDY